MAPDNANDTARAPRRIVTGHDSAGRSVVAFDDSGPNRNAALTELWVTDRTPADNSDPADAAAVASRLAPPDGGTRFRFFTVAPEPPPADTNPDSRAAAVRARFAAMGAESALVDTTRHPAMHRTRTIDYIVLLSGRVTLLLDEAEVDLEPFDSVVQRGTNHAWVNRGDSPALLAAVLVDAAETGP